MTPVKLPERSDGPAPDTGPPSAAVLRRLAGLPLRAHLALGTVLLFVAAGLLGPIVFPFDAARTSPPDRLLPPGPGCPTASSHGWAPTRWARTSWPRCWRGCVPR